MNEQPLMIAGHTADVAGRPRARFTPTVFWVAGCLLLSLGQVLWAGYRLGVGNQGIQIAFLQRWMNPTLYGRDAMVVQTMGDYPSFFFRMLAAVVPWLGLPTTYLLLHLLTAFATLAATYAMARAVIVSRAAAGMAVLLLLAGHRALAGEELYSVGFTHTWAVFPVALAAMAMLYRGWHWAAFALAGLLFNFHALTGAYLGAMFGAWAIGMLRWVGWRKAALLGGVFVLLAAPTWVAMIRHHQSFDAQWRGLTHIRSALHSFPSTWWQSGNTELPRFVLLVGLGALSLSFPAGRLRQRTSLLLAAGAGGLFVMGYVFTDLLPVSDVIRLQAYRASRLLLALVLVHIANGVVRGWKVGWRRPGNLPRWRGALEILAAAATFVAVALPPGVGLLPAALGLATAVALINGRLGKAQAVVAAICGLVCLAAWRQIGFPLVGLERLRPSASGGAAGVAAVIVGAAGLALLWLAGLAARRPERGRPLLAMSAALLAVGVYGLVVCVWRMGPAWPDRVQTDPWVAVQQWVRSSTPADALILTPSQPGGFRIHSQRSVVGEWRDGTQLYFTAGFAPTWWERMNALQPGLMTDERGGKVLSAGRSPGDLDDAQILGLCAHFGATHIVLPAGGTRELEKLYENARWAVYLPRPAHRQATTANAAQENDRFMREVVLPNIEKYRKGDVRIQVVDSAGRAAYELPFEARQTRHGFEFGCSLPFFKVPPGRSYEGFKPPAVDPRELTHFLEIFNYSMIPFSGKWMYVEPQQGQMYYDDLDLYVDWCAQHKIDLEYHFISGYQAPWVRVKPRPEQGKLFLEHARQLAERYGNRIKYWQVVNEKILIDQSPPVFQELRRLLPEARLGIADCAKFHGEGPNRAKQMLQGLAEVQWLKQQGVKLDYFGFHGHRPLGLWPDAREAYEALDAFANEGVKLHITEFTAPMSRPIVGSIRQGQFTPELQAEFYEYFYTLCFSHPAVEMINLWGIGPVTWQDGSGLLDSNYKPKPVFYSLRDLIQKRWTTQASGKLALDGSATFRGFYGDYELTVRLPSGGQARTTITITPGASNEIRLVLDRDKATLTRP